MAVELSPYRLGKARDTYNYFNIFNAVSWQLLVGVILTLFALRLGASSTYIGLLSASFYVSLFFLPVGKMLTGRFSIIGIFSATWILRSAAMTLAIIAPFFVYSGKPATALLMVMTGVFVFQVFRGIGMIGNNPVLSLLASGPDRGSYMTQLQIMNSAIGMFCSFTIAMILGMEPPLFVFSILLTIGLVSGIISGYVIKKVPEPAVEKESRRMNLIGIFKDALSQDSLKSFMAVLFLVALVSGVTRTFAVVYAREVFGHNDGLISLYNVFGGLGFLLAGLSIKFLVDRIGAKPLFLVCIVIGLVSMIPVVFLPSGFTGNLTGGILFLVFMFFMLNFGFLGSEGIAHTYFLALIPADKVLNLGILYFFIFGAAGALGSSLSGLLLDFLEFAGVPHFFSFKILYAAMGALALIALSMQKKMKPLNSLPLRGALEIMFSFRDLRAISILDKLSKAKDSDEEKVLLGALHGTPSHLAIGGLLERARSPHLATRLESIRALEKMNHISLTAEKALIDDIDNNPYTTAYISARILGNHNCTAARYKLRKLAYSGDYMLAGESIIALAKMNDRIFLPEIEKLILDTDNPRLKIMGAEALGKYHDVKSIPALLNILRVKDTPHYLRDEVILAIAAILDTQKKFYKIMTRYTENNSLAVTLAMDEAEAAVEFVNKAFRKKKESKEIKMMKDIYTKKFLHVVSRYMKENDGVEFSRWILDFPISNKNDSGFIKQILSEAVLDEVLCAYDCLRLLIIHGAAQELRINAATIKTGAENDE